MHFTAHWVDHQEAKRYREQVAFPGVGLNAVGAQIDVKLALMSSIDATFSIGYALAFERQTTPTREFMVSLKILSP